MFLKIFEKDARRYTDNNNIEEYRINIVINVVVKERAKDEVFFAENDFTGETTYFVTGTLAKSENTAIEDAIKDLARRVVERTIENW